MQSNVFETIFQQQFWNITLAHQVKYVQKKRERKQETCTSNSVSRDLLAYDWATVSLTVNSLCLTS